MSKTIIKWVGRRLYKIYFDHPYTLSEVKNKVVEMGYELINVEYFRDLPVALVSKGKLWYV